MKVQCDVCGGHEASVFCCADEAALCQACDLRVHRANKLAGKHRRFALSSSPQSQPVCDICQEKRGFVFCQQDRAILCRDCDGPVHSANELTMKHSRFLLTGVRLSPAPIAEAEEDLTSNGSTSTGGASRNETNREKPAAAAESETRTSAAAAAAAAAAAVSADSSSISEYLIKMLPGYCVEDLLVDDAVTAAKDAFYKSNELMPFVEADLDCGGGGGGGGGGFGAGVEDLPIWVPHVPQAPQLNIFCGGGGGGLSVHHNYHQHEETAVAKAAPQSYGAVKMGRERWSDDSFMVPQMNRTGHGSLGSKRHRTSSSAWDF
ncbi:salt tolerance-like protein [Iris pallida]|uniref:Salt tolerance-like protein n=1 Tax=Iris pallida TaxID=29817 RepID=A0AAX6E025_IRIPA|nr:salt tolerance-like protein [Iris pallida]